MGVWWVNVGAGFGATLVGSPAQPAGGKRQRAVNAASAARRRLFHSRARLEKGPARTGSFRALQWQDADGEGPCRSVTSSRKPIDEGKTSTGHPVKMAKREALVLTVPFTIGRAARDRIDLFSIVYTKECRAQMDVKGTRRQRTARGTR